MSTTTLNLTEDLRNYLLSVSLRESPILTELRAVTAKLPQGYMQISPEQSQFMALLVRLIQPKKLLEIGVYTGYSALTVALASSPSAKIIACDVSKEWTDIAQKYWEKAGVAEKIELRLGPASETLDKLLQENQANTFDFIFIDADKKGYDNYYEKSLQLLRSGGLILLDNMLQQGRVAEKNSQDETVVAIQKLNEKIHHDSRVELSLLPISDGLTLVMKK